MNKLNKLMDQKVLIEKLAQLNKEYPELEVIPMFPSEQDSHGELRGEIAAVYIDKYFTKDGTIYFRHDDWDELLDSLIWDIDNFDKLDEDEQAKEITRCEQIICKYPWKSCVALSINTYKEIRK